MNKLNHDGLLTLEQPFVKVPLEQLKKTLRTSQKDIEKELSRVTQTVNDLAVKSTKEGVNFFETANTIENMVGRLNTLKRKLNDSKAEGAIYLSRSKQRLAHLNELTRITNPGSEDYTRWSRVRLDRILVDYMLREGFSKTAGQLAKDESIEPFVDIELFTQTRRVEQALQQYSCTEALAWCNLNKTNLRKMQSTLEFNLRLQEFIELVRANKKSDAIAYSRKYLTAWSDMHIKEIQQAMCLLAFPSSTFCPPYKKLYDESRWDALITQFRADNFALNSLTSQPLLNVTLQAGLSALKTPMCYQTENRNINCPVCTPETLGPLAQSLPLSHHVNSTIVCRLSGEIMDENNPPMTLPNGYVYSLKALTEMASKNNGKITCPRTGVVFNLRDVENQTFVKLDFWGRNFLFLRNNVFTLKIAKAFDAEPSSLVATTKIIISLVSSYKYDISPILDELPEDSKIRRFGEGFGTGKGRPNKGFNAETSRCKGRKIRTNKGFNAETSRCKGKKNTKNQNYQIVLRILRMISNTALNFFYDQKGCTRLQDKTTSFRDPTDSVLMKLVQDAKFVSYLKQICLANNSRYKDVEKCMGGLYHTVSKQLHGHDKDIEIDARDWSVNEFC
ncbi:10775_t:CDS:10 [Entrophospora sp. SA101]|nr:10775_t:CDS:10 [Entrophospora sp. SA101]